MKLRVYIGSFLAALVIAAGSFWAYSQPVVAVESLTLQQPCDLHQAACEAHDNQGRSVQLRFTPNTLPLMQPLTATVAVHGVSNVRSLQLSVEGVNMYMGFQSVTLQNKNATDWQGELILPVCTQATMQWQASLLLDTPTGKIQALFPFVTQH